MGWWKRREKRESDLERELRSDLELEAADFRDQGLSGAEARWRRSALSATPST